MALGSNTRYHRIRFSKEQYKGRDNRILAIHPVQSKQKSLLVTSFDLPRYDVMGLSLKRNNLIQGSTDQRLHSVYPICRRHFLSNFGAGAVEGGRDSSAGGRSREYFGIYMWCPP